MDDEVSKEFVVNQLVPGSCYLTDFFLLGLIFREYLLCFRARVFLAQNLLHFPVSFPAFLSFPSFPTRKKKAHHNKARARETIAHLFTGKEVQKLWFLLPFPCPLVPPRSPHPPREGKMVLSAWGNNVSLGRKCCLLGKRKIV